MDDNAQRCEGHVYIYTIVGLVSLLSVEFYYMYIRAYDCGAVRRCIDDDEVDDADAHTDTTNWGNLSRRILTYLAYISNNKIT